MKYESRPEAAIGDLLGGGSGTDSIADRSAAVFFRNCYAVLVRGKSVRRHLYFNLPAAERQVKRAEARGDAASMVLVKLVPVDVRRLDEVIGDE